MFYKNGYFDATELYQNWREERMKNYELKKKKSHPKDEAIKESVAKGMKEHHKKHKHKRK